MFQKLIKSPYVNLTIAIILMISAGAELSSETVFRAEDLGAHHGVMAFGVVHALKAVAELLESGKLVEEVEHERRAPGAHAR